MERCGHHWALVLTLLAAAPEPDEVKAQFVERFTRFIEWPPQALQTKDTPFVVCALGHSTLGARLEQVLARGTIQGHPVRVRHLGHSDPSDGCHILYIPPGEREHVGSILERLRGKPVLSVGDTAGFSEQGVIINLFLDQNSYVRFEINSAAARASGLAISARLMSLAKPASEAGKER
jgi:hypothetical protein